MKYYFATAVCLLSLATFSVSAESACPTKNQEVKMGEALNAEKNQCLMNGEEIQARWDEQTRSCSFWGLTGRRQVIQYYFDLSDCSSIKLMYRTATKTEEVRVITDQPMFQNPFSF